MIKRKLTDNKVIGRLHRQIVLKLVRPNVAIECKHEKPEELVSRQSPIICQSKFVLKHHFKI